MSDVLAGLLADLGAETTALHAVVADLDDAAWRRATPAPGWTVAHQVAHLAWTDRAASLAAADGAGWHDLVLGALEDPGGFVDRAAAALAAQPPAELLRHWQTVHDNLRGILAALPAGQRLPWFGPPMSATSMATARLMETWAHGLDVRAALGVEPLVTDRIRHVAHLGVRTRDFAYALHELTAPAEPFRIELDAPSGERWTWGPPDAAQRVAGAALDFCLLVTQRAHRDDTALVATGADAVRWLEIAQCFAGPPGPGRARA